MGETRATRLSNDVRGPKRGLRFKRATSNTQAALDLSAYVGRMVAVTCFTTNVYVGMEAGSDTTTYALDGTATSGNGQCWEINVGDTMTFFVETAAPFLHYVLASSTGYIRVAVISAGEDPT